MPPVNIVGELLDTALKAAEDPTTKAAILADIQAAEGGVEAAIVNLINTAPKPSGFAGLFWPTIVKGADAAAVNLVAKYGPEVVFDVADQLGHTIAAKFGG